MIRDPTPQKDNSNSNSNNNNNNSNSNNINSNDNSNIVIIIILIIILIGSTADPSLVLRAAQGGLEAFHALGLAVVFALAQLENIPVIVVWAYMGIRKEQMGMIQCLMNMCGLRNRYNRAAALWYTPQNCSGSGEQTLQKPPSCQTSRLAVLRWGTILDVQNLSRPEQLPALRLLTYGE